MELSFNIRGEQTDHDPSDSIELRFWETKARARRRDDEGIRNIFRLRASRRRDSDKVPASISNSASRALVLGRLVRIVGFVRFMRFYTEKKNLTKGARHVISENKRRFQQDGFDLDLVYVTSRIVAMSYPSSGKMSWYRNPIQVRERASAEFFEEPRQNPTECKLSSFSSAHPASSNNTPIFPFWTGRGTFLPNKAPEALHDLQHVQ